jgi:hypothetical protein
VIHHLTSPGVATSRRSVDDSLPAEDGDEAIGPQITDVVATSGFGSNTAAWIALGGTVLTSIAAAVVGVVSSRRQALSARESAEAALTSARESAETALTVATQDRFGPWQLKKREVYANFLAAAQPLRASVATADDVRTYNREGTILMLYAYHDARQRVASALSDSDQLQDEKWWSDLIDTLRDDVHITGPAT